MNGMFGMGMKSHHHLLALILLIGVCACGGSATPAYTPLVRNSWNGITRGYSEVKLDSNTYQVTYADYYSTDEADRFALFRSAELTDQNSFDYFIVTDSRADAGSATKTVRMYKGATPTDNPSAYNAKSMLAVMGPTINK
jgi:hypothetical protein